MEMEVYGFPHTTCTMRVMAALKEMDLPFRFTALDFHHRIIPLPSSPSPSPSSSSSQFLELQPFENVPVLQDQDILIFDSRAIIRYISHTYSDRGEFLYGRNLKEKALVEKWLEVETHCYNTPASQVFFELVVAPRQGISSNEYMTNINFKRLSNLLDLYEIHLGTQKYLAGDFFSLADLSHLPYTYHIFNHENTRKLITSRKNVYNWWKRISSRPSWKSVIETNSHR